jgi:hypothetical protein
MNVRYEAKASHDFTTFRFISVGPRGSVSKIVSYTQTKPSGYHNLGFGDENPKTGFVSDTAVTNNDDSKKVLATVASTLYTFFKIHQDATVVAFGSTQSRTRLYQIGVSINLEEIKKDFVVWGMYLNEWQLFKKGIPYQGFMVRRKQ